MLKSSGFEMYFNIALVKEPHEVNFVTQNPPLTNGERIYQKIKIRNQIFTLITYPSSNRI